MILPRDVRSVRVAPRMAHRWSADLRRRAEEKKEAAWELEHIRQERKKNERDSDFYRILRSGFMARNSGYSIGEMYPTVREVTAYFHKAHGQMSEQEVHKLRRSVRFNSLIHM